jgi:ribonucleoside-triphosphate reductase
MASPLSARAEATTRRTYNRPLDDAAEHFETWEQTIDRAQYCHQRRLWEDAQGRALDDGQLAELAELRRLGLGRRSLVAGRTLWLGGTEHAYSRPCCQFNCAYTPLNTVYDVVDAAWLLLNGSGVGGKAVAGVLHGYNRPIPELEVVPSDRPANHRGRPENAESSDGGVWRIGVGDSAEAWAKALGKLLNPRPAGGVRKLVLDFSQVRGPGGRLKGYGWICNGYEPLAKALTRVHAILNRKAGQLLDEIDIGDIHNLFGTVLSSRRSAEILFCDSHNPSLPQFRRCKEDYYATGNEHRGQSNNSILYWSKPPRSELSEVLDHAYHNGDPAPVNAAAALRKAPWFQAFNPCAEIMLAAHGFCNLVTSVVPRFGGDFAALERAAHLAGRANYRQTCVDLNDGLLQPAWHQTNQSLRLCGVSLTGLAQSEWLTDYHIRRLRNAAVAGAYGMADELGLPRPKAVTTVKPEGTSSKICDVTEGVHKPLGRFVFNWVTFSKHDPLVGAMEAAGYRVIQSPVSAENVLVCFPVEAAGVRFDRTEDGREVNRESAVTQLDRYLRWNTLWADHNVSCTISFDRDEIPAVVEWLDRNWDAGYVAAAFLRRTDPTLTAKDLNQPYLPQEVVTRDAFRDYADRLAPVVWDAFHSGWFEIDAQDCAGGSCPVK